MSPTSTAVELRSSPALRVSEIELLNDVFADAAAADIIAFAHDRFGSGLCMTASMADTLMIDIATKVVPDIEVLFIDTGFHFPETLDVAAQAEERYGLNLVVLEPNPGAAEFTIAGTETCCNERKVGPLERALIGQKQAWLSGLRRADSPDRAEAPIFSLDRRGLVKINPIAAWTDADVADYIEANGVIVHPLQAEGYGSIGCAPCTTPVIDGDPRSGRWAGTTKTECGLHL